jgi:hypothetical protein
VLFCAGKRTQCKGYHKEIFTVYGGKCLSCKAVHNWVEKCDKHFAHDERVETEVAETTVERLLCCRFRLTGKAMGEMYQCWWRICREICSPGSNVTYFTFYNHLWPIY